MGKIVSIDAMGGDHGLDVTIDGACLALKSQKELSVILFGDSHIEQISFSEKLLQSLQ